MWWWLTLNNYFTDLNVVAVVCINRINDLYPASYLNKILIHFCSIIILIQNTNFKYSSRLIVEFSSPLFMYADNILELNIMFIEFCHLLSLSTHFGHCDNNNVSYFIMFAFNWPSAFIIKIFSAALAAKKWKNRTFWHHLSNIGVTSTRICI